MPSPRPALLVLVLASVGCNRARIKEATLDFFADRSAHPTVLAKHAPSPQAYDPWPEGEEGPLKVVEYHSAGRTLRGLFGLPSNEALAVDGKLPLLVYLHGGFALGEQDLADCTPFVKAGFAVWAPAFRGENGNPGDYELLYGELDDARAAVRFVPKLEGVDPSRVVVFGHSSGGMLSALLALSPDLPVRDTGSAGGLYGPDLFDHMDLPFVDSPTERRLRLFAPYTRQLKQPHFACVGDHDGMVRPVVEAAGAIAAKAHVQLATAVVSGDHLRSLAPCMEQFLARVLPKVR
jgi:dienelactone hydrolase